MNSSSKHGVSSLLNNSSTATNKSSGRISDSISHQHTFITSRPLIIDLTYNHANTNNNHLIATDFGYLGESEHNFNIRHDVSNNMKSMVHQKNFEPAALSVPETSNKRRKFSPEEDIQLKKLIALQGPRKWDQIALSMPGRTGRQCRDRFYNYLDPSLINGPWTIEEDVLLEQKVYEIGQHWNVIAKFFNGRSTNNIKNRWYTYVCCDKKVQSSKNYNIQDKKNNQKVEYQITEQTNMNSTSNILKDKFINNFHQNNFQLKYSNNPFIPIITLNGSCSRKKNENCSFNEINDLYSKNKNEKKIFLPSLISSDGNILML